MNEKQIDRMCRKKTRYKGELDAKLGILHAEKFRDNEVHRYYQCPICHGYHITSKKRSGRR